MYYSEQIFKPQPKRPVGQRNKLHTTAPVKISPLLREGLIDAMDREINEVDVSNIDQSKNLLLPSKRLVKVSDFDEDLMRLYGVSIKMKEDLKEEKDPDKIEYCELVGKAAMTIIDSMSRPIKD